MTTVFREQEEIHQENREEDLRRLRPVRTVGDQDVGGCCPACGHRLAAVEPLLSEDPVVDVVPDRAAFTAALRTVVLLVDVLDQRRPPKHLGDLVEPLVLRYLRAVPAGMDGLRGGVRLLSFHPAQPHEGVVESPTRSTRRRLDYAKRGARGTTAPPAAAMESASSRNVPELAARWTASIAVATSSG